MIHKYSMASLQLWTRGEVKVQVLRPGSDRAIAYCDGTDEDIDEFRNIAEEEGGEFEIHRRVLKTGREIWTLGAAPEPEEDEDYEVGAEDED